MNCQIGFPDKKLVEIVTSSSCHVNKLADLGSKMRVLLWRSSLLSLSGLYPARVRPYPGDHNKSYRGPGFNRVQSLNLPENSLIYTWFFPIFFCCWTGDHPLVPLLFVSFIGGMACAVTCLGSDVSSWPGAW